MFAISDLNLIYCAKPGADASDELISGSVKVDVTESQAITAVLKKIGRSEDDVEENRVFILPSKRLESKAVYAVTLKFYNDKNVYKYEVDCRTGEVSAAPANMPPSKNPPDVGSQTGGELPDAGAPPRIDEKSG